MDFDNSYEEYRQILRRVAKSGKSKTFEEAETAEQFIVIRHDVEFSLEKALQMAIIESQYGAVASYFIQIGNMAYNAFSEHSLRIIRAIASLGHEIGLHYRQSDEARAEEEIGTQAQMLSQCAGVGVNLFSTHRPQKDTRYHEYKVAGMLNAYSERFFTRTEDTENVKVRYIADSKFRWNYGRPDAETIEKSDKIQLLVHPFQWQEEKLGMEEVFAEILGEKTAEQEVNFANEFGRYKEVMK